MLRRNARSICRAHRSAWYSVLREAPRRCILPGSLQVIKGLPDAPVVAANIRLRINPRLGRALPDTLAVSDDGAYLLYSTGGPIEMIGVAGDSRQVMAGGGAGSLAAFAPGGHDAAIVDSEKLILFQNIAGRSYRAAFRGNRDAERGGVFSRLPKAFRRQRDRPGGYQHPGGERRSCGTGLRLRTGGADSDGLRDPPDRTRQRASLAAGYGFRPCGLRPCAGGELTDRPDINVRFFAVAGLIRRYLMFSGRTFMSGLPRQVAKSGEVRQLLPHVQNGTRAPKNRLPKWL